MRNFHLLLLLLISFKGRSQYTITSANSAPAPGDVQSEIPLDTTGIIVGPAGINQTWNYSTVISTPGVYSWTFVPLSSVPNASLFPNATIGSENGSGTTSVLEYTSSFTYLGSADPNVSNCFPYSDPATYFPFPFSYGSTSNDLYSVTAFSTTTNGTITSSGDATGNLQLPTGSVSNVLRIKTNLKEITGSSFFDEDIYTFYAQGIKFPVMTIWTYTLNSGGIFYGKGATIHSSFITGIFENKEEISFSVYPNPNSTGIFNINLGGEPLKEHTIRIYNLSGQELKKFSQEGSRELTIDAGELPKGIYFIKVDSNPPRKLIVQ